MAVKPTRTQVQPTSTQVQPTSTQVQPTSTRVQPTSTRVSPTPARVPPTPARVPPARAVAGPTRAGVKPTRAEVVAAGDRTIPDVIAPGLRVLFSGINPGLYSAATGRHFARPGNRFWPALHRGGFTPRQLRPEEQEELLDYGLGVTNLVERASARADELGPDELLGGARALAEKAARYRPALVAMLGVTAYRLGFARPRATFGLQPELLGGARLWVLPNPSGLNAHYTPDALAAAFAELRLATPVDR